MDTQQKIVACADYSYEKMKCGRIGLDYDCFDFWKRDVVCSDPADSVEEAGQSLNLKLLEAGKNLQNFHEEKGSRTVQVYKPFAWKQAVADFFSGFMNFMKGISCRF